VHCTGPECSGHNLYDSSQSASYQKNGSAVQVHYARFYTFGFASVDTMRVGGLEIENQAFEEATKLKPFYFWNGEHLEGVLGLPRLHIDDSESTPRARSQFHNIIQQGLLEKNMFSLKLSRHDPHETGELLLGATNPLLYIAPLVSFPISNTTTTDPEVKPLFDPGWQIDAHSMTFGHPDEIFRDNLTGYVAAFSTSYTYIGLPRAFATPIIEYLKADDEQIVDCARRSSMPDLVFNLEHNGVPSVLKPEDYIRRHPAFNWGDPMPPAMCTIEILLHDETIDDFDYIVLSAVFLSSWYSVFDYDNSEISCKFYEVLKCVGYC
jgi:saccharopepsin